MNIALDKAVEYVNGAKKRTYGDAFVRGNNGELIHELCFAFSVLGPNLKC